MTLLLLVKHFIKMYNLRNEMSIEKKFVGVQFAGKGYRGRVLIY
jgi:hypothetical protein